MKHASVIRKINEKYEYINQYFVINAKQTHGFVFTCEGLITFSFHFFSFFSLLTSCKSKEFSAL